MASQGVAANSRLAEMQMKFQKKQLLEREQKKLALAGGDGSASDTSVASKNSIGNGKVRQMFDERRRGVGIDRSHPLKPIATTTTTTVTTKTSSPAGGVNVPRRSVITNTTMKKSSTTTRVRSINNNHLTSNGNGNGNVFSSAFDDMDNLDNETFPKEFSSLSLDSTRVMGSHVVGDRFYNNNNNNDDERDVLDATITISKNNISSKTNGIKLNPVITKKSPNTTTTRTTPQYRIPSSGSRMSTVSKPTTTNIIKSPLQKLTTSTTKNVKTTATKAGVGKPATFVMSVKPPPRVITPPPGMAACHYCQRNFSEERLEKHEEVCRKMTSTKRKIFDASKHRVKGTEAEKYLKKGKGTNSSSAPKHTSAAATINSQAQPKAGAAAKKGNWRKKHEEFITAIREAKKVQAYLAKGGKLSDLPPPPPSENPDYVQCPHCNRRFNESAAERHIPKCANMQHNKPKPPAARKRY